MTDTSFTELNKDARIRAICNLGSSPKDFPTWPWESVTKAVGPLLPGTLVIVGGVTGNGKTAFLLNLCRYHLRAGLAWGYFGLELADYMLVSLLAALDCGLPRYRVMENAITPAEREALIGSIQTFGKQEQLMHFVPDPSLSVDAVVARIADLHRERSVRFVVIDHLHQLNFDGSMSARLAIGRGVRLLKECAKTFGITIVASAQLRREIGDKAQLYRIPGLTELLETGAIEQVADVVVMVHRQVRQGCLEKLRAFQKGDPSVSPKDFAEPNRLGVSVAKHRFGRPVGVTVPLRLEWPSDRLWEVTDANEHGDAWEGPDAV